MNLLPITVIIPSYCTTAESLDWLKMAVDSALANNCSVIVWDDGSPLDIEPVFFDGDVDLYYDAPLNVQYSDENKGVSNARNSAASLVDTVLLFPLDCDDFIKTSTTMQELYDAWDPEEQIPIIPDLTKLWSDGKALDHRLVNWSCETQLQTAGIASVNVLHTKEQWKSIGGWDESLDFYEDTEYNARLLLKYCGKNVHIFATIYRMHDSQKTALFSGDKRAVLDEMKENFRSYDMACCGKGKKQDDSIQPVAVASMSSTDATKLPGTKDGRVLVLYTGGQGQLKHYYRGRVTKYPYKVTYGDYLYVDPADADVAGSNFERVATADTQQTQTVERTAVQSLSATKTPVRTKAPQKQLLIDISTMTVKKVKALDVEELGDVDALIAVETGANGKNRVKMLEYLRPLAGKK